MKKMDNCITPYMERIQREKKNLKRKQQEFHSTPPSAKQVAFGCDFSPVKSVFYSVTKKHIKKTKVV